jgi:hypothetical protein
MKIFRKMRQQLATKIMLQNLPCRQAGTFVMPLAKYY